MREYLLRALLMFLILPVLIPAYSQVSQGGQPPSFSSHLKSASDLPVINLDPPGDVYLPEESEKDQALYRVAIGHEVDIDITREGDWEDLPGKGRICRLIIRSAEARGIHIFFEEYALPDGGELYIYNKDRSRILGAFTSSNNKSSGKLAIQPVRGDEITVEYFEPFNASFPAALRVGNVGHNYRENILYDASGFGDSQACNKDINCTPGADWQTEKRSVCKILYKKGSGNYYICTGALINNARHDGSPYFLTANHCVSSSTEAESILLYFNYESPTCNGPEGPDDQTVSGSTILATTYRLDFSLIELSEEPPPAYEPYYAGWDAREVVPDNVASIHHPMGDVKKISTYSKSPVTDDFTYLYDYDDSTHWYIDDWTLGMTEGESSGSPLFNSEHRIVGDLTGGSPNSNCTSCDAFYAKLSDSWDRYQVLTTHLKPWLDPDSTGVMFIDGHDPLNPVNTASIPTSSQFTIYPNPARDFLYIKSAGSAKTSYLIEIVDLSGKIVQREEIRIVGSPVQVSLSPQLKGYYMLRLTGQQISHTQKLILQ